MRKYRHPIAADSWGEEERAAWRSMVNDPVDPEDPGEQMTMGLRVAEFEEAFARRMGAKHGVMVNSGSSALLLAAFWKRSVTGPGGIAVCPALTWPTTVWPFMQAGFKIEFVDVDPETLTWRKEEVYQNGAAVLVPVHMMGNPAYVPQSHALTVIADSCESAEPMSGALACYSFYFSHHLQTVEGGMVLTNVAAVADWLRVARNHGMVRHAGEGWQSRTQTLAPRIDKRFLFSDWGFNVRPMEVQGAVGLVQLGRLDEFNRQRRYAADRLRGALPTGYRVALVPQNLSPFALPILAPSATAKEIAMSRLEAAGIETRGVIGGGFLLEQPAVKVMFKTHTIEGVWRREFPGAREAHERGFFIGLWPGMGDGHLEWLGNELAGVPNV